MKNHGKVTYIFSKGKTINPFSKVLKLGIIPVLFFLFLLQFRKQKRSVENRSRKCLTIKTSLPNMSAEMSIDTNIKDLFRNKVGEDGTNRTSDNMGSVPLPQLNKLSTVLS